jgi:hypothetical protein
VGIIGDILAAREKQELDLHPKCHYPDLRGAMDCKHVFIIGNSPSIGMIPDCLQLLSDPRLITVAINRALVWMEPWAYWAGDGHGMPGGPLIPPGRWKTFKGPRFWYEYGAREHLPADGCYVPFCADSDAPDFQLQDLAKLYQYTTSDTHAVQAFFGIMYAEAVYLVGIDQSVVDGRGHHAYLSEDDRTAGELETTARWRGGDELSPALILHAYRVFQRQNRTAGVSTRGSRRGLWTCSPVEGTVVRQHLPFMPLEEAIERALEAGPVDPRLQDYLTTYDPHVDNSLQGV